MRTLICHTPGNPGARPLKLTVAGMPPTVTSGETGVTNKGKEEVSDGKIRSVAPCPVP
jgi:hypothetical protein